MNGQVQGNKIYLYTTFQTFFYLPYILLIFMQETEMKTKVLDLSGRDLTELVSKIASRKETFIYLSYILLMFMPETVVKHMEKWMFLVQRYTKFSRLNAKNCAHRWLRSLHA